MGSVSSGRSRAAVGAGVGGAESTARDEGRWQHGSAGLPVAVSSLVGRQWERAEVAELVASTRLVTFPVPELNTGACSDVGDHHVAGARARSQTHAP